MARRADDLLGRTVELEQMQARIMDAMDSRLTVQLILGEAGIGKTTLLNAVLNALPESITTVVCHADEADVGVAYSLFIELSHRLRASSTIDSRHADRLDEIFEQARGSEPGDYVYLLAGWLRDLIDTNEFDLLVLAVEDIHNLDSESLRLLTPLIRTLRGLQLDLVFTSRRGYDARLRELQRLLDRMSTDDASELIDLKPLDNDTISELALRQLGSTLEPAALGELLHATAGNPFLAEQYLAVNALDRLSHAAPDPSAENTPFSKPIELSVGRLILSRFFPVEDDRWALAQVLSLFRGEVHLTNPAIATVAELYGLFSTQVAEAWDGLVAAGVLCAIPGSSAFTYIHPLVREAVYESIGVGRRKVSHLLIAETMSAFPHGSRSVYDIANHYYLGAESGNGAVAADAALVAAADSEQSASSIAALWLERALELMPMNDDRRIWTYLRLIYALLTIWTPREAMRVSLVAEAEFRGRAEGELIALPAAIAYLYGGHPEWCISVLDTMSAEELDASTRFWAAAYRPTILLYLNRPDDAVAAYSVCQSIEVEVEAGDETAIALSDVVLAGYNLLTGGASAYELHRQRCISLVPLVAGPNQREITGTLTYLDLMGPGRLTEMTALLSASYDRPLDDRELGLLGPASATGWTFIHWLRGNLPLAQRVAHLAAQETENSGTVLLLSAMQAVDVLLSIEIGAIGQAQIAAASMEMGALGNHGLVSLARAKLLEVSGDLDESRATLAAYLIEAREAGLVASVGQVADQLVRLYCADGQTAKAQAVADEAYAQLAPLDWPLQTMLVLRARGVANGRTSDVAEALRICDELGLPFERLNCEVALAGLGDDPSQRLLAALIGYRSMGAAHSENYVKAELRRAGLPVPRRPRAKVSKAGELSEAESKVAQLVVDGMTNREISIALFISVKTVEVYLSRIYEREGVRNRVQLTAKLLGHA